MSSDLLRNMQVSEIRLLHSIKAHLHSAITSISKYLLVLVIMLEDVGLEISL